MKTPIMNYAVVRFDSDQTYSEVPVSWLADGNETCWWPFKTKNPSLLMTKGTIPDPSSQDWQKYNVTVDSFAKTLESARKKAEESDYISETDGEHLGRGKRIKRRAAILDSDSEEENTLHPPQLIRDCSSTPHSAKKARVGDNIVEGAQQTEDIASSDNISRCSTVTASSYASVSSMDSNILSELLNTVGAVYLHVKNIDQRLKEIEGQNGTIKYRSNQMTNIKTMLPLNTISELENFEEKLKTDASVLEQYKLYVTLIGGRDDKDTLQRILKKTFTNRLGTECSWLGLRSNYKMQNLKVVDVIREYIMSIQVQESIFERVTSEWFRLSKLRLSREKTGVIEQAKK